jgi:RNA polymerase sigma-70 factor (ECF subfamily)
MNTDEPLPTRASFLQRLRDPRDNASWDEFHRTYRGLLIGVACRAGLTQDEAEEALQETLIAVARKLPEFVYRPGEDSFKGWLLQITRWKVADQFRKRQSRHEPAASEVRSLPEGGTTHGGSGSPAVGSEPSGLLKQVNDFDRLWDAEWERHLLDRALTTVKRQAKPAQYAIYHLHVIEERSVEEVRGTLSVSTSQVYLAKHRVGRLVKRELRRLRDE